MQHITKQPAEQHRVTVAQSLQSTVIPIATVVKPTIAVATTPKITIVKTIPPTTTAQSAVATFRAPQQQAQYTSSNNSNFKTGSNIFKSTSPLVTKTTPINAAGTSIAVLARRLPTTTTLIKRPSDNNAGSNNSATAGNKMEHSYTRDNTRPINELSTGLAPARTIFVRRKPQCPSCHTHPLEEHELEDGNQATVPTYNEIAAKESMNECGRIAKCVRNTNPDDDDWESRINQIGWSSAQKSFFTKVARILDNDQLGRLANAGRTHEPMQRRVVVDKSAARMRKLLASVAWDARLVQWLHFLLMDSLPSTYMASYLDILQTLKTKLPTFMDKVLFSRPFNMSQELLAPVMKHQWEPAINTKMRKLTQIAVIVALPALPNSGPIPNRLQKWYQHMASITQIVQVTLPMTSGHVMRQPLEQIAEQIVSVTRVKIQDLRNSNPTRSIILIGFGAGSALALQVAMSENIACVVCMGFAFNTFNGVRGAPDDRILDIKIPILFVVGQNSARSSAEEIESLREKMQSETSLVVVGSADDNLRVPKSRRRVENVSQTMIDTMVVDEVYEFIKKILTNPPGPRIPTAINSVVYPKQNRASYDGSSGSGGKMTAMQRKRKQDMLNDSDQTSPGPAKTKYMQQESKSQQVKPVKPKKPKIQDPFQVKRKVGRPRTRPLATPTTTQVKTTQILTSTPVMIGNAKSQQTKTQLLSGNAITNEDLNLAMQSLLGETNEQDSSINTNADSSATSTQKLMTNFEIVAQTKSTPLKTTLINPLQKQNTPIGTKIKMIPSNQFVQLKPPLQSQSKIYTIKTTSMLNQPQNAAGTAASIGSIVSTTQTANPTVQQQIFTLKSPNGQTTQFVTAAPAAAQQKYTVVKNAAGGTTLQLTTPKSASASGGTNVDLSNINDMPIIFADNDGNLSDAVAETGKQTTQLGTAVRPSTSSGVGQLIISQKIIKEANTTTNTAATASALGLTSNKGTYVINKTGTIIQGIPQAQQLVVGSKPNKVVFINRNTMKPCPNIISRSNVAQQLPKYTKVVVTNPKTSATTLVPRPGTQITTTNASSSGSGSPIVSTVKQVNLATLKTAAATNTAGILNVNAKPLQQFQIINSTTAASTSITSTLADKPQIRNIVVKPGGLKQIPAHLKTQLLNRNLTVRKLVNIVPSSKATGAAVTITPATVAATTSDGSAASASTSAIQTSPKIITLNPINPSASVVNQQPKSD